MCLAIPARVVSINEGDDPLARSGVVDLQGSRIDVSLAMVPDAGLGAWVLIHAGYAIEQLDEEEAKETWRWLRDAKLVEGELPEPPSASSLAHEDGAVTSGAEGVS